MPSRGTRSVIEAAEELALQIGCNVASRERTGGSALAEHDAVRRSGLLRLRVPQIFGGMEANWSDTEQAVRAVARADSSLAHIFSWHQLEVVTAALIGTARQSAYYYDQTVAQGWFWGSALNPTDARVTATRESRTLHIDGTKSFCTGARGSDMLLVGAVEIGTPGVLAIAIPSGRPGVQINDDWDNMGQRQSDSGSVTFTDVIADEDEVLGRVRVGPTPRLVLRSCLSQLMLSSMLVGIAQAALEEAKPYTLTQTRPWPGTSVNRASEEPMMLHHYGEMWVQVRAATLLVEDAARRVDDAWATMERGAVAETVLIGDRPVPWHTLGAPDPEAVRASLIAVDAAKVMATQVGLEVTSRTFEVMGARATSGRVNHDRHWRNMRTLTLHDPVEMRLRELGDWFLNNRLPVPDITT